MENEKMEPSGHMTNNMADVIWLGKQMERMREGSQLSEDMRFPDPIQFDEIDNDNDEKYQNKN
ncbi:multidrug ABC transporter ATPase [Ureibacillus sp. MALMAid1270]|uniref:multidrug ABC transporter ATPase n=1 Tax=Ureibacillus sp. MALMAid1270 TaxID=3411629 RepID=UPI003BA4A38D